MCRFMEPLWSMSLIVVHCILFNYISENDISYGICTSTCMLLVCKSMPQSGPTIFVAFVNMTVGDQLGILTSKLNVGLHAYHIKYITVRMPAWFLCSGF